MPGDAVQGTFCLTALRWDIRGHFRLSTTTRTCIATRGGIVSGDAVAVFTPNWSEGAIAFPLLQGCCLVP